MDVDVARPTSSDDREGWKAYWVAHEMPWRTEPEIDQARQAYLAARRAVMPDLAHGIYPFRDEHGPIQLMRADVEWLLATHASGGVRGPVDWADEAQRERKGIDIRGADLSGQKLHNLPLARVVGGWLLDEAPVATAEQLERAAVHLEGADFRGGFERQSHLEGARLTGAHLEGASLYRAHLERVGLDSAFLQGADLARAHLEFASLAQSRLEGVKLLSAHLEGVNLSGAYLAGTRRFAPADVRRTFLSNATALDGVILADPHDGAVRIAGAHWGDVDVSVVAWENIARLGDEQVARNRLDAAGKRKDRSTRLSEFEEATRANRQLATALKSQGLNEDADRFAYRAQLLQRALLRRQGKLGQWLFSLLLWTLAGYGYRLQRIFITYILTLTVFALAYYVIGLPNEHTTTLLQQVTDAYQVSLTAIHGRTFFEQFGIGSNLAWVAATESVCGLVIEAVFTSMLVQRFFAR